MNMFISILIDALDMAKKGNVSKREFQELADHAWFRLTSWWKNPKEEQENVTPEAVEPSTSGHTSKQIKEFIIEAEYQTLSFPFPK